MTDITSKLTDWLRTYGFDDINIQLADDFCYYPAIKTIHIPVIEYEEDEINKTLFVESLKNAGLNDEFTEIPYMAMSFLHELGHYKTLSFYTDEEMNEYWQTEDRIYNVINIADVDSEEYRKAQFEYFNLPVELDATVWAVGFANDYPNLVWDLEDILNDLIDSVCSDENTLYQEFIIDMLLGGM